MKMKSNEFVDKIKVLNKSKTNKNIMTGIIFLLLGILIILFSIIFIKSINKWCSFFIILGMIISLFGFSKFTKKLEYSCGLILNLVFFLVMLLVVFLYDYMNVKNSNAPIFRKNIIENANEIYYDSIFYDVYACIDSNNNIHYEVVKNEKYNFNYCNK